jgi:hypothetical protein
VRKPLVTVGEALKKTFAGIVEFQHTDWSFVPILSFFSQKSNFYVCMGGMGASTIVHVLISLKADFTDNKGFFIW